jgi:hypothetical protein
MDVAAVFRGDRFRLVSGIVAGDSEIAREFRRKSCSAWRKRRADSLGRRSLHGHATIGSPRKIRNKRTLRRFSEAIVAGWFCRNRRNPLEFPAKGAGPEKKSGIRTSSGAKSPAKCSFPMSRTASDALKRGQNGAKRNQRLGVVAAVAVRRRVLRLSFQKQSKGPQLSTNSQAAHPGRNSIHHPSQK